ncbi:hypothetical protein E4T49_06055 [Aureobasidium sp. EXF-10728]|nr:hypothetical protein E4T49_06055 [Aureobasidium sp. EXF-10728]
MRAATRFLPAILIITVFFLVRTYLYRLPIAEAFHGSDFKSLVGIGDDASTEASTKVNKIVGLASTSAPNDGGAQATATAQDMPSATKTTTMSSSSIPDQIVVMGKTNSEDTSWVEKLPTWRNAVYSVDNDTWSLHTSRNKGREANVYLTYLVENYQELPSTIAFVHPHENGYPRAWHTDADDHSNVKSLSSLRTDFVQSNGYANLRCIAIPGCPDEIQPFRESHDEEDRRAEHAMADAWKQIFGNDDVPKVIGTPCCAQFAVSRDQVRKRTLEFYVGALKWLHETPLDDATIVLILANVIAMFMEELSIQGLVRYISPQGPIHKAINHVLAQVQQKEFKESSVNILTLVHSLESQLWGPTKELQGDDTVLQSPFTGCTLLRIHQLLLDMKKATESKLHTGSFLVLDGNSEQTSTAVIVNVEDGGVRSARVAYPVASRYLSAASIAHPSLDEMIEIADSKHGGVIQD